MLRDEYDRVITNLRIAVTNRCNLQCFYCHKEGERNSGEEIDADRIIEIARAFRELGVRKLKDYGWGAIAEKGYSRHNPESSRFRGNLHDD